MMSKKSSKRAPTTAEEQPACSSSSGGANGRPQNRLWNRHSIQRLLYRSLPSRMRTNTHRSASRKSQAKETATKSTSTAEVQSIEVVTHSPSGSPTSQHKTLPLSPLPSPASTPSSSSELHPLPQEKSTKNIQNLECPLCLSELPEPCFPSLSTCEHRSCYDCLQQYLKVEISESRTSIACPECSERLHPNDVRMILNNSAIYNKYEDFMVRRVLAIDPDTRWCPQPDCGFAIIASGCASCPKIKCQRPGCPGVFCYHCKADWHPNQTCDAARTQRKPTATDPAGSGGVSASFQPSSSPSLFGLSTSRDSDIKPCPRCSVLIVKMDDGSCNHMTCAVCGAEFCWLCMKEISDLHYLSPSGCTFWGKKPWSRKKKILWQLGMLVGAPVGIGLVAGIALPAMTIGIPVWVGRKLYGRYRYLSKHKRNLIITSGVIASIFVSPFVALTVVSIGVPILLFYIYGVVPVSLCRSGGCDVSTSGSGFHFDFDDYSDADEDEDGDDGSDRKSNGAEGKRRHHMVTTELGARLGYRGGNIADAVPTDSSSNKGTNPSIGEASLSMDSGSHVVEHDDDEETDKAAGSKLETKKKRGQSMEIQADVQAHRHSLCSEETIGSEKSGNTLDDGAASTRALAGSILSYKVVCETGSKTVPVADASIEVHQNQPSSSTPLHREKRVLLEEARSKKSQEGSDISLEHVRFDDNVSVYNEIGYEKASSVSRSPSLRDGKKSPSGSLRSSTSVGRAIRHLLMSSRKEKIDPEQLA
ncbi:E3 ubiquitin-protein ligase RNF19B-like [Neocloeon triangulifer]|uniref:E3 ubiquitin-protein ligase RNF19B-like n=1 Tax=Neocloeon triangulifer TaxID=2078957 RepID=UPI00286EF143|nr:E3 ubiquitin-protein ligase RNF19B-like [Neocloeon triangulifer]